MDKKRLKVTLLWGYGSDKELLIEAQTFEDVADIIHERILATLADAAQRELPIRGNNEDLIL